ncbi:MAG: hypothetical protein PVI26_06420 [Chitinispirillia bacterium]
MNNFYYNILKNILDNSKKLDYKGYNKHDGLLSPILYLLMNYTKFSRLIAIQLVMRFPFNIRPLLLIPRTKNPKGIGLFAYALMNQYLLTNRRESLNEAEVLLKWLDENASMEFNGKSWGYQYPWQDIGFFAPAYFPNRVVTCWIGYSFIKAWKLTKRNIYLDICKKICDFLREAPNRIINTDEELCFSYVPVERVSWAVMDVSALVGKMLALTGVETEDDSLLFDAKRCINYVANRQTDYGAWFYTDPSKDSHITHDNYHTGIILDCIYDYMKAVGSEEYVNKYKRGLEYYDKHLFLTNGAPKWMNNRTYPLDIHGAAQGIISFSKAADIFPEYIKKAASVSEWTVKNMLNTRGDNFYYQKGKIFKKRFTLLRWCNAWMSYAISSYLVNLNMIYR